MIAPVFTAEAVLAAAQKLPSGPRLVVELGQAIRNPNVDTDDIVKLVRQDAALVARLLRVANSPFYARSEPAGSI